MTTEHLSEMQILVEEAVSRVKGLKPRLVQLPSSGQPDLHVGASSGSRKLMVLLRMEVFD